MIPAPGQTGQPRVLALGRKIPIPLAVKTSGSWSDGNNCWIFRKLHLEGPHDLKTYANPPTLGFNTWATAGRVPVTYRELMK